MGRFIGPLGVVGGELWSAHNEHQSSSPTIRVISLLEGALDRARVRVRSLVVVEGNVRVRIRRL